MVITKWKFAHRTIENMVVKSVDNYKYLRMWLTSEIDQTKLIKIRTEVERTSFIKRIYEYHGWKEC